MTLVLRGFPIDDDIAERPVGRHYKFILQMYRLNRCSRCSTPKQPGEHRQCAPCHIKTKAARRRRYHSKKAGIRPWEPIMKLPRVKVVRKGLPIVTVQIDQLLDSTDMTYSGIARQLHCSRQLVNQRSKLKGINWAERFAAHCDTRLTFFEYEPPEHLECLLVWNAAKRAGLDVRRKRPIVSGSAVVKYPKDLIINGRLCRILRCTKLTPLGFARFYTSRTRESDFTIMVLCVAGVTPTFYVVPDYVFKQYRGSDMIQIPILTKTMKGVGGWWTEYAGRWDLIIPSADFTPFPVPVLAPRRLRYPPPAGQ